MEEQKSPLYELKKQTASVSIDSKNVGGGVYDVEIYEDKVLFKGGKGFYPSNNQFGLIGMLIGKIFANASKTEDIVMSLTDIKKVELYRNTVMGKKMINLMFWNINPGEADYKNITFSLSLNNSNIEAVKGAFSKVIAKADYNEVEA